MYYPEKLEISDVMKIYKNGMPQNLEGLAIMFIKNLVMLNFTCRDKILEKYIHDIPLQKDHSTESSNYQNDKNNNIVNPLDLILAVFKCSSPMLKQILATKLFMCKLAIPLVFPAVANDKMLVSVWPLRSLINNSNADPGSFQDIDVDCPCQIVSFIRFGRPTISKSKTINEVLSDQYHDTFLNKDSPLGTTKRVLSEGMIEVAWYIPSSKDSVLSKVCMFLNLRGDGEHFEEQVKLLSSISSVVVLTMEIRSADNTYCQNRILSLHQANTGIIIAIDATADSKTNLKQNLKTYSDGNMEFNKQHKLIELYDEGMIRSTAMIKNEMRNCINELIKNRNDLSLLERLHTCSADVDEYNECFSSTRKKAEGIIKMIPTNSTSTSIIEQVTPLQGKLLRTRDQKNKDVNKASKKINMEEHLQMSMNHTRLEQLNICKHIGPFMRLFLDSMLQMLHSKTECAIFVLWLKHFFDERSRNTFKFYLLKYNSDCQALKTADISAIPDLRDELDKSEYNLSVASFGFEHICREMGQIYEAICSCKRTDEKMEDLKHQLPIITAKLLLLGLPFEIVDGNVANIPIVWIKAVLRNLKDIIGDKRLLALSVLGIQSSGKSTLLNTMFGLQFAISPGRCTRGVFMQLIPVDDNDLPFQWVLAIDTEGLNAPELRHQKYSRDNELATFVVGLGDITIVNIRGENTAEVKDVLQIAVHAFLRLKVANEKLNLNQSCVFVHQNVSAADAHNKLFQKRQKFVETLDAMAIQAAAEENIANINSFNQVIEFDSEAGVWYISDLWRRDLLMCPPNPGYSENVSNVRNALMFDLTSKNIRYLTVTDTISRIEDLLNGIKNDDFVFRFRNSLEFKAYNNLERKCQTLTWNLEKHVLEFIRSDAESSLVNCENPNDLEKVISSLKKRLAMEIKTMVTSILTELDSFIDGNTLKELMIQWKQKKQSRLREVAEYLIVKSKSEINKMEEEIRFKKMRVSEQTKLEIEINKTTSQLALKMRGKSPKERVMKQMFDDMWNTWQDKFATTDIRDMVSIKDQIESWFYETFPVKDTFAEMKTTDAQYHGTIEETINIEMMSDKHISIHKMLGITCKRDMNADYVRKTFGIAIKIFRKIDIKLKELDPQNKRFNISYVAEIVNIVITDIDDHNSKRQKNYNFSLLPSFRAMMLGHVLRYATIFFTRYNDAYYKKHSSNAQIQAYKETTWDVFKKLVQIKTEEVKALIFFREEIIKE
ncbi:Hypothetical predicted protein [Mytilus galloprovincialis]|uniref:VLIG-type G domain-containing protein n=1 Tax=Mytilus galloprovincialis TaxID=29158 RepID=A0A8B6CWG7_MYTGA|nr:Hypothetical predicted protein [Mytilus galloprovincialis]